MSKDVADTAIGRRDASDWDEKKEQYEFFEENFRLDADTDKMGSETNSESLKSLANTAASLPLANQIIEQEERAWSDYTRELVSLLKEELQARDEEVRRLKRERGNGVLVPESKLKEMQADNKRLREALEEIDAVTFDTFSTTAHEARAIAAVGAVRKILERLALKDNAR